MKKQNAEVNYILDISIKSAQNIAKSLDTNLYQVFPIHLRNNEWTFTQDTTVYHIDKNDFSLTIQGKKLFFDCVFIVIHGNPEKMESYRAISTCYLFLIRDVALPFLL